MTRERSFQPSDRYRFDFGRCSAAKGWAQIDTRQDASYFGQWINPKWRQIISYAEGDVCVTTCADDSEMLGEMEHIRAFHNENDAFLGIDPGFNAELREALLEAGLRGFFHASDAARAEVQL